MNKRNIFIFFAAGLFLPTPVKAVEVTPVYDLRFFGGQHFYDGDVSSVGGNFNLLIAPAMKFNEKWTLLPTYTGSYRGTRDVQELAGGGTLFRDSTSHGLNLKGIYGLTERWKLKATSGATFEFLREARGENLGEGLFDYKKFTGGIETQFDVSKDRGGRLAYDYYQLIFPNYTSLESSQDPTLSRELAGTDVLDSGNHLITLTGWSNLPGRVQMNLAFYMNLRNYGDQPVVAASGDLTGTDRKETTMSLINRYSFPFAWGETLRFIGDLGLGYSVTNSNQNHYDARKTVFVKDYYDYSQVSVAPQLTMALGKRPWIFSAGTTWARRKYSDRPIQDVDGNFEGAKTRITDISTSFGLTYPISKNFKARFLGTLGWSDSNMKYEKVFRYNYKIANYMFGFSYAY